MEGTVTLRFYAELNDHLGWPASRHAVVAVQGGEQVGELIEGCGVPLGEVDLAVVDGESVDFSHPIVPGDRIGVYPVFEAFDVSPLVRTRSRPLRVTRFLVDDGLEPLADLLRNRGLDTVVGRGGSHDSLIELARAEGRIILTRDEDLVRSAEVTHACLIAADGANDQLAEVAHRLQLDLPDRS